MEKKRNKPESSPQGRIEEKQDDRAEEKVPAVPEEHQEPPGKKGIWEVSYESGAIIGYYEGTPRQIAAFLINTDEEGRYIRKLSFLQVPIRKIPERLMRTVCCSRTYSKNDNYCSRCGKTLKISDKIPSKVKIVVNEVSMNP
jgi:hypothetical protein